MSKLAVWSTLAASLFAASLSGAGTAQSLTLTSPDLREGGTIANEAASAGFDLHFHTLAKATLTALYGR